VSFVAMLCFVVNTVCGLVKLASVVMLQGVQCVICIFIIYCSVRVFFVE